MQLFRPDGDDKFVGCQALEGLKALGEIVGVEQRREMGFQLIAAFVVVALDGRFLNHAVHSFDLAIGPGIARWGAVPNGLDRIEWFLYSGSADAHINRAARNVVFRQLLSIVPSRFL